MKRLIVVLTLLAFGFGGGVSFAATLKPLAAESAWNSEPIFATAPPGDPRLFVVERGTTGGGAAIRVLRDGILRTTPFLSIPNVNTFSERGLLSMAFAPDYETSGLFYVFWIADGPDALDPVGAVGDIRIVEFKRSESNPDVADPASARLVLKQPHSAGNHNGGWMGFGPDGYLYLTIGDNALGSNSQSLLNLFGKVIRLDPTDPDGAGPLTATIPADNPFVSSPGARGEIFAYGLRNPYRASFAPDGGLVVADVGQSSWEEVNVGNLAGKNMGWPVCEGPCLFPDPAYADPFFAYSHADGCAIIGGYVVRDPDLTGLNGRYLYGDACRGGLRTLNLSVVGADPVDPGISIGGSEGLRSFGEDSIGCTYVLTNRNAYRIAAGPEASADCPYPPETRSLTLTKSGTGSGTVTSSPAGIDCGSSCSASFDQGTQVTLTATPAQGSTFTGWSGACSGTGTCLVTMASDQTATAAFTANTALPKARIGKVTVSGPAKLKLGRTYTYKAKITNSGNAQATGVRLTVSGRGIRFNAPVGRINAGVTRTVNLRLRPKRKGRVKATFKVTSDNAGGKTVKKTITVKR